GFIPLLLESIRARFNSFARSAGHGHYLSAFECFRLLRSQPSLSSFRLEESAGVFTLSRKATVPKSMKPIKLSRRSFVKNSAAASVPALLAANILPFAAAETAQRTSRRLKVVCVGGHPDDPESGCAGTLARYSAEGHSVTIVYLTRGERGIPNTGLDEAARIRTAEAEAACKIIGAKAVFAG